ncbi:MAG: sulfatase-like hydrolase/transferase [Planctomycetia bacterium]|nr:sulfatase-like hydrolase/transferase [Planctomycetia bacterium]
MTTADCASAARPHAIVASSRSVAAARAEVQQLGLALVLLLVATKIVLLPFPVSTIGEFVRYLLRLAIVAAPDVCFAVALTTAAWASCPLWSRGRLRRPARTAWFFLFYVAGLYGAMSVPIFQWTKVPLTLPVFLFVGGTTSMASSIESCVSLGTLAAVVIAPLALLVAPWLLRRLPERAAGRVFSWRIVAIGLVLTAAYEIVCRQYVHARWTDPNRWERRIAQNPHAVFLESCLKELWSPGVSAAFAEADESDFRRQRPSEPQLQEGPPLPRPQNVVVIVLESTAAEYLNLYGSRFDTMPNLARMAADRGVVFDNFYVQTPSSCNSLVSITHGVIPRLDWTLIVRDSDEFSVPSLPRILGERGYRSCFAHAGYWKWKERDEFLRRAGVDRLIDADTVQAAAVNSWGIADRDMFQATLDWVDEDRRPFFLLTYTIETHHPYVARPPLKDFGVDDRDMNRYLNSLRATDETIAWFLEELSRRGLLDSTLVVLTADHGESFGQHNQRVHSFSVYESAVHVPLVLIHPALADRARHVAAVRPQIDLPWTLLSMLGVEPPGEWQGDHLFRQAEDRAYFFAVGNQAILGLRDGPWKYHFYVDGGDEELFNLAADPGEMANLASREADRCAGYKRRLAGLVTYQREFLARHGSK